MSGSPKTPVVPSTEVPASDTVAGSPSTDGNPSVPTVAACVSAQRACAVALSDLRDLYEKQGLVFPGSIFVDTDGKLKGIFRSPKRPSQANAAAPAGSTPMALPESKDVSPESKDPSPVSKDPLPVGKEPTGTPSLVRKKTAPSRVQVTLLQQELDVQPSPVLEKFPVTCRSHY